MMRSMTGFGSEFKSTDQYDITVELKSLNSRYFDFKLKTSASIDEWENDIKNAVNEKLKRGKIDLYIKIVEKEAKNYNIVVNYELANKYEDALSSLSKQLKVVPELTMRDFVTLGNILQIERTGGYEDLYDILMGMIVSVIKKVLDMMNQEGEKTKEDIETSLSIMEKSVTTIEIVYPLNLEKYKQALKERIMEFLSESREDLFTNNRLLIEAELVASRTAINEELVRLKSHLIQFKNILSGKSPGDGKKLDFIGQEMNREANTIASKSSDYQIIENTIIIKGEIEKIREQLRNLE